jgi:hypothetical protein
MPFWPDTPVLGSILSGLNKSGHKVYSGREDGSGTAPVVSSNPLTSILNSIGASTVPWWYNGSPIHGQGTMAPDSPKLVTKDWESDPQGTPPSIFDKLIEMALGGGQGDMSQFSQAAQASVNAAYDPQIEELKRLMASAEGRAGRNKTELGNMYGSLSKSDLADIPVIDKMFGDAGNQVNQQYAKMQGQTDQAYNQAQQEQMDLMKRLNIQAAAPDALKGQQQDKAFFTGQTGESRQSMQDSLKLLQTGADNFSRQGSEIAQHEGTNRQADLMAQLQDYLSQSQGKLSDLNLAKSQAYQAALGQGQQSQHQQQNDTFNHLLEIAKLQQSMQGGQPQYKQGPLAAAQYLSGNAQDPSALSGFLQQVMQGQAFTTGQIPGAMGGQSTRLTPEAAAQMAQQQAAQAGMSPENQQAIYQATLAYYGRMY